MFIEHLLRMLTSVPKIENIDMNNLENYGKDPPPFHRTGNVMFPEHAYSASKWPREAQSWSTRFQSLDSVFLCPASLWDLGFPMSYRRAMSALRLKITTTSAGCPGNKIDHIAVSSSVTKKATCSPEKEQRVGV